MSLLADEDILLDNMDWMTTYMSKFNIKYICMNDHSLLGEPLSSTEPLIEHGLVMFDDKKLVSFVDGFCTNSKDLSDEMYANASLHNEQGKWQMIFGVNTIPTYRKQGLAGELIKRAIFDAKAQGRLGLVLTCKEKLIHYYSKFGFVNEGLSKSTHGNVEWYQMRLTFK